MNELFQSLLEGLKRSSLASKLTAGLVAMAVVLAVAVSAVVSNRPHFQMLMSGLNDSESVAAMNALAGAGIAFQASQPPGPFVIYVDEGDRSAAMAAIYGSGAMIPIEKGIQGGEGGMASVFMSNGERQQLMQKNIWGETEKVLESLNFVASATVMTSTAEASPFSPTAPQRSATVQLTVRGGHPFTDNQANTVVMMVSRALEIAPDDIVLTDQTGRLWNGDKEVDSGDLGVDDWFEFKQRSDLRLSDKANLALAAILGPNRARVEVDTLWSFDQSTTSSSISSDGAMISKMKSETETPVNVNPPDAVGASSNVDFGVNGAAVTDNTQATAVAPQNSTTSEETTSYTPSVTRTEKVHTAPELQRLSVALFLDESVAEEKRQDLEDAVKAAVGYDDVGRSDNFKTVSIAFAVPEVPEGEGAEDGAAEPAEEPAEPNPMMEMLLRRGVEIAVAAVFIFLLLSSLKTPKAAKAEVEEAPAEEEPELDPEVLAQAQVQELLNSDPERVGEILSQWARETEKAGA